MDARLMLPPPPSRLTRFASGSALVKLLASRLRGIVGVASRHVAVGTSSVFSGLVASVIKVCRRWWRRKRFECPVTGPWLW